MSNLGIKEDCKKSSEKSRKIRIQGNNLYTDQGNHNEKVHLQIFALYNKSAALAENNSEELALAISNRSALLMHLHQYENSLKNIEKSYQITKCDKLKAKLLARKTKCLTLKDELGKNRKVNSTQQSKIPVIEKVSKIIPCAADCVSIEYDKNYGRLIIATKDIEIGTIIAKEKAIVLLPKVDKIFTNCSHCLTLACNGVPCNSCASIIYCSEKCKEEAWLQYHDVECSILSCLHYGFNEHLIFALRLLIKFIKQEGLQNILSDVKKINFNNTNGEYLKGFFDNKVFQSKKFQSFYNLSCDLENNSTEQVFQIFIPIIKDILKKLTNETNIFNDYNKILNNNEDLLDFFGKVLYKLRRTIDQNAYEFQDMSYSGPELKSLNDNDQKLGAIVTPFCSLFNHSCDHNASRSFTKNQEIVFYAVKLIKKGEQIFTNYGAPLEMERNLRQRQLKTSYNFMCKCQPCKNNWPTDFSQPIDGINVHELISKLKRKGIIESDLRVFCGNLQKDVYNKTTLKQAIKMCHIIQENYSSDKASIFTVRIKSYFHIYYDKLYNIRSLKIFESC